jgi:predicted nucleic acid-binding protein
MIVADTNLVVPLLLEHEKREQAVSLFSHDPEWHLPDWWQFELSNVLRNYHRAGVFSADEVDQLLSRAGQVIAPENTHETDLAQALRIACACDISTYDACFIALARAFGQKLITEDRRLRAACPDDTLSLDEALANLP